MKRIANISHDMVCRPLSWCIDHKLVACISHNWRSMMKNLLKLHSRPIYECRAVTIEHPLTSSGCQFDVVLLAMDWFALKSQFHRQCLKSNSPIDLPSNCHSNCYNFHSIQRVVVAVPSNISFRWELKHVKGQKDNKTNINVSFMIR